jgi:hypothetical protein
MGLIDNAYDALTAADFSDEISHTSANRRTECCTIHHLTLDLTVGLLSLHPRMYDFARSIDTGIFFALSVVTTAVPSAL